MHIQLTPDIQPQSLTVQNITSVVLFESHTMCRLHKIFQSYTTSTKG